jgi:hypothetical protein
MFLVYLFWEEGLENLVDYIADVREGEFICRLLIGVSAFLIDGERFFIMIITGEPKL